MVKVFILGITGTILGILAGVYELFVLPSQYTPQQLAASGLSTSYLFAAGIAAFVFSFIGLAGALVGERGLPSFLLTPRFFYSRERTTAAISLTISAILHHMMRKRTSRNTISAGLLIIGAIGIFLATSLIGLPSTILFAGAGVIMWRKKDETALEQETDEMEQEIDAVTY